MKKPTYFAVNISDMTNIEEIRLKGMLYIWRDSNEKEAKIF